MARAVSRKQEKGSQEVSQTGQRQLVEDVQGTYGGCRNNDV